jgi:hypothetical protein
MSWEVFVVESADGELRVADELLRFWTLCLRGGEYDSVAVADEALGEEWLGLAAESTGRIFLIDFSILEIRVCVRI